MKTAHELRKQSADPFFQAVLLLRDEKECRRFFEDILTPTELHTMANRVEVARLISKGCTYQEVIEGTGASTATVSRVKRVLESGSKTLQRVLARLDAQP